MREHAHAAGRADQGDRAGGVEGVLLHVGAAVVADPLTGERIRRVGHTVAKAAQLGLAPRRRRRDQCGA